MSEFSFVVVLPIEYFFCLTHTHTHTHNECNYLVYMSIIFASLEKVKEDPASCNSHTTSCVRTSATDVLQKHSSLQSMSNTKRWHSDSININALNPLLQLSLSKLYNITCLHTARLYCHHPAVWYFCLCVCAPWKATLPCLPTHDLPEWACGVTRSQEGSSASCSRARLPLLSGHFYSVSWIHTHQRLNRGAACSNH